jgi:hypothetical protein
VCDLPLKDRDPLLKLSDPVPPNCRRRRFLQQLSQPQAHQCFLYLLSGKVADERNGMPDALWLRLQRLVKSSEGRQVENAPGPLLPVWSINQLPLEQGYRYIITMREEAGCRSKPSDSTSYNRCGATVWITS